MCSLSIETYCSHRKREISCVTDHWRDILVSCVDSVEPSSYLKYMQIDSKLIHLTLFAILRHNYSRIKVIAIGRPYSYAIQGLWSRSPVRASCLSTGEPRLQTDSHLSPRVKQSISTCLDIKSLQNQKCSLEIANDWIITLYLWK